jgi:hypothetical protein
MVSAQIVNTHTQIINKRIQIVNKRIQIINKRTQVINKRMQIIRMLSCAAYLISLSIDVLHVRTSIYTCLPSPAHLTHAFPLISGVFGETEQAAALREIRRVDPAFDIEEWTEVSVCTAVAVHVEAAVAVA